MSIVVGYKFKSKCEENLEVVDIIGNVCIVKDSKGRIKKTVKTTILDNKLKWTYSDGAFCPDRANKTEINVGDIFDSNNFGKFTITDKFGHVYSIKFINTGYQKESVRRNAILKGHIKDKSMKSKNCQEFHVGKLLDVKDGTAEVIEYVSFFKIICRILNTNEEVILSVQSLKNPSKCRVTKRVSPVGHYIYYAWYNDKVVYVGRGKGFRYTHINSGRSSNRELNRLHFLGEYFKVTIEEEGLTYEESKTKEKLHISKYSGLFNEVYYC